MASAVRLSVIVLVLICFSGVYCGDVLVRTTHGYVRGTRTENSLQFLGIPYARAPVGDFRWKSPEKAKLWAPVVYNATKAAPACPQKYCKKYLPANDCPNITQTSEDCLYLYVWTPLDATNTSRYPVMVFIHGGAFKTGYSSSRVYDGNDLVREGNVILVNIDYRTGVLGFLYTGDGPADSRGNFGLQDQRLALQWVQGNIQQFGGDPNLVTLFGQSAGAQSVSVHLQSKLSEGLFHKAIIQSSPFSIPYRTKKAAVDIARVISRLLKCREIDMKCLRSKTTEEINDAQQESTLKFSTLTLLDYFEPLGPIIDDEDITYQPMDAAAKNRMRNMPVILGSVTEECVLFIYSAWRKNLTKTLYEAALALYHPSDVERIEREYPAPEGQVDLRPDLSQFCTDIMFTCATRNVSRNMIKFGNKNVYRYVFDHVSVSHGGWGNLTFCYDHVCHAEELSFIFGNGGGVNTTEAEVTLHDSMVTYWSNFAYTGNPNDGPRLPKLPWRTYDQAGQPTLRFRTPENDYVDLYRDEYCNFLDQFGYS